MGVFVWWAGVSGKEPGQVLEELGLERGEPVRDYWSAPVVGASLPNGWFFVFINKEAPVWYEDEAVAGLSAGCRVVTFEGQETAMYAVARGYVDGRRIWGVEFDGDGGRTEVPFEGDVPPEFHSIHDEIRRRRAEATDDNDRPSLYEVVVELGKALAGFRYYDSLPDGAEAHELHGVEGVIEVVPVVRPAPGGSGPEAAPPGNSPPENPRPAQDGAAPPAPPRPWWKFW